MTPEALVFFFFFVILLQMPAPYSTKAFPALLVNCKYGQRSLMHSLHFFLRGGLCVRVSYRVPILLQIFYQPVHCSFELFVAGMLVFDAAFQQGSVFLPRSDDGGEPFIVCNGNVSSLHALLLRLGEGGICPAPTFVPLPNCQVLPGKHLFITIKILHYV